MYAWQSWSYWDIVENVFIPLVNCGTLPSGLPVLQYFWMISIAARRAFSPRPLLFKGLNAHHSTQKCLGLCWLHSHSPRQHAAGRKMVYFAPAVFEVLFVCWLQKLPRHIRPKVFNEGSFSVIKQDSKLPDELMRLARLNILNVRERVHFTMCWVCELFRNI